MAGIEVRPAEQSHLPVMLNLALTAVLESPEYRVFTFDPDKTLTMMLARVKSDDAFARVVVVDGQVVGMMVAHTAEFPMSSDRMSIEDVYYILPAFRGKGVLKALVSDYNAWSLEQGVNPEHRFLCVTMGINDEPVIEALKRLGYQYSGTRLRGRA